VQNVTEKRLCTGEKAKENRKYTRNLLQNLK
jgi:hypothetical protein